MLNNKGKHDTTKLGSNVVQELKINQRRILIDSLEIKIPAPEQMIALGERQLSNGVKVGQLLNSKTLNYKKLTPHRDGLFCERIFGPVQSFVCACGKKKESIQNKSRNQDLVKSKLLRSMTETSTPEVGIYQNQATVTVQTETPFCPKCQVEYISKNVRRHRLGYIKLFAPATHIWYLKGRPSYLSLFLGKRKKAMTSLAYCNAYLVEQVYSDLETHKLLKDTPDKSFSTAVGKGNVKIWKKESSNDLNTQMTSTNSGSELFLNLLMQLLPKRGDAKEVKRHYELPTNKSLIKAEQKLNKLLLELIPLESKRQLEKGNNSYYYPITSSTFVKPDRTQTLDFNRVTNQDKKNVKRQDLPTFHLNPIKLRYQVRVNLKAPNYSLKSALHKRNLEQDSIISKQSFGETKLLSFESKKHQISSTPYIRAQSLPFLPSLISPFHLRDSLISFLQSLPLAEDIPIPMYCQTPRRYPLRDVHKFLAELRSTNNRKQAEKLTSLSITNFLGYSQQPEKKTFSSILESKQTSFPRSFVIKKTPRTVFVHKPRDINLFYKNQINAFRFASSIEDRTNQIDKISQRVKQNIKERSSVQRLTPKQILVEKPLSKEKNEKQVKRTQFWRARIKTPIGQYISLSTVPIRNHGNRVQQQKSFAQFELSKAFAPKVRSGSLGLQNGVSVPKIEAHSDKLLPKLALLPLTFHAMRGASSVQNRFLLSLSSALLKDITCSYKNNISKRVVPNTDLFPYSNLHSKRSSVGLSLSTQILPQETGMSTRGVLLNTFLDMFEAKLVTFSLPLSTKSFRRDFVKTFTNKFFTKPNKVFLHFGFVNRKASNLFYNVEKNKNNKLFNSNKTDNSKVQCVLPKQKRSWFSPTKDKLILELCSNKRLAKPKLLSQPFVCKYVTQISKTLSQLNTQLFPKLAEQSTHVDIRKKSCNLLHSSKDNVGAMFKYRDKGLTYTYLPTRLYIPNPRYNRKRSLSEIAFRFTPLRYKYDSDLILTFPSKKEAKTLTHNVNNVNKDELGENLVVKGNAFSSLSQIQDGVTVNLRHLLFRRKIETYQERLLHIVFGTFFQDTDTQLTDSKHPFLHKLSEEQSFLRSKSASSLYQTYLVEKETSTNNSFSNNSFSNSSFSSQYQRLGMSVKQDGTKVTKLGYMYLLSKHSEKPNQGREKEKVDYALLLENRKNEKGETRLRLNSEQVNPVEDLILDNKNQFSLKQYQNDPTRKTRRAQFEKDQDWFSSTATPPTSLGSETISKWQTKGAKEILLYTGGGALESLLKRFNTSLFCQFLLSEIQILRKHYREQIVFENDKRKTKVEQSLDSSANLSKQDFGKSNSRYLNVNNVNVVTTQTLNDKEEQVGLKSFVTDKVANLFCRRIFRTTRRLKIVQLLMRSQRRPEWMMISILPVLPPDLRPVLQMGDNLIVASDLNTLYQRVIYRNNRHYKGRFLDFHFVSSIHRLVQDAVDRLIENGKGGSTPFLTPGGRPLKSLSDILKGKRGRFRFNLLGKRVDFSGRSVIVVSPNLKIHECGLPREMALELYKYLLIRQLLLQKRVSSIVNAKKVIKQRKSFIWDILRQIIYYHPLLLNRAPTLHRLGIQAFQPKLSLGNAILLHPLVCAGFNADFDGDQMGVHLPLSPQARAEAWDLLWSRNNLLSPATGQPILLPSQDMVLGFYYMSELLPYGTTNKTLLSYRLSNTNEQNKNKSSSSSNLASQTQTNSLLSKPKFLNSTLFPGTNWAEQSSKYLLTTSYNYDISNPTYTEQIDLPVLYVFSEQFQVVYAYQKKQIDIHTPIWLKWAGKSENGEKKQAPLELRIDAFGNKIDIYPTYQSKSKMCKDVKKSFLSFHIRTTVGRVLINNLISKSP